MPVAPPDLKVSFWSSNERPSVHWSDGDRLYHFWLNADGTPQNGTIHSNPKVPPADRRINAHRALSMTAKRWAPTVAAIMQKISTDDLIAKAKSAQAEKNAAETAERVHACNTQSLAALDRALAVLPAAARDAISNLPADTRLAFVSAIETA